jgi:hypothetical protein
MRRHPHFTPLPFAHEHEPEEESGMFAKYIGEGLIFLVSLPLFTYQTFEGMHALADVWALISEYVQWKS